MFLEASEPNFCHEIEDFGDEKPLALGACTQKGA